MSTFVPPTAPNWCQFVPKAGPRCLAHEAPPGEIYCTAGYNHKRRMESRKSVQLIAETEKARRLRDEILAKRAHQLRVMQMKQREEQVLREAEEKLEREFAEAERSSRPSNRSTRSSRSYSRNSSRSTRSSSRKQESKDDESSESDSGSVSDSRSPSPSPPPPPRRSSRSKSKKHSSRRSSRRSPSGSRSSSSSRSPTPLRRSRRIAARSKSRRSPSSSPSVSPPQPRRSLRPKSKPSSRNSSSPSRDRPAGALLSLPSASDVAVDNLAASLAAMAINSSRHSPIRSSNDSDSVSSNSRVPSHSSVSSEYLARLQSPARLSDTNSSDIDMTS